MSGTRDDLEERRDLALRDLAELDAQVDAGEVDQATADHLRTRYESDAATAIHALQRLGGDDRDTDSRTAGQPRRRVLAGVAGLAVIAAVTATVALPTFVGARPDGGFVTGNEATAGRDLSQVSTEEMEAVVAANPDVVPMRLRLAHRYVDAGEPRKAVDHYMAILDRQPEPEAMSHLGWILFEDGKADLALELLESSRELAPDEPETLWFLANVHLYGHGDPEAAVPLLERLMEREDLGAQRTQVEQVLADARSRLETQP